MPRFDASTAECLVFTFKEGVLSPLSRDLKIRATRFEIEVEARPPASGGQPLEIRAHFDAGALRTACAADAPDPGLSDDDCRTVDGNLQRAVLHTEAHPDITFQSTRVDRVGEGWVIRGLLGLHGVTRPITVPVHGEGDRWVAEVELDQRDWHIRPYTGLMGTFRIKPLVRVRVSVPRFSPR